MKVSTILDHIDSGNMVLPEFQRGYVWNREQVRNFMLSLYKQHPVGSLLVWATESENAQYRGSGAIAPGVVKLLLDGQQRITSLYGIIRGSSPQFFEGNATAFTGLHFNLETEEFRFYMPTIMDNDPLWVDISWLMRTGSSAIGVVGKSFADDSLSMQSFWEKYAGRLSALLDINNREFHIEEVTGRDKTLEVVVDIFNRVNSGGTKLSRGDLALAKICATWPEARTTMKTNISEWQSVGFSFDLDWQLRIINAILTGEAKFEFLHSCSADEIKLALDTAKHSANYLLDLIGARLGLDHDRVLFGRYAFPVMARYLDQRGGSITEVQEQNKLLLWYLLSSIWGRYSSSTQSIIDKDLAFIEPIEGGLDRLLEEVQLWQGGLTVSPEHFNGWSKGARFYPLLYLLSRTGEAKDFGTGLPLRANLLGRNSQLEVHHIFPKSLLYGESYAKPEVNALANYCFLTMQTNNSLISNRRPEEYFPAVEEAFPGCLESQWIPMDQKLWKLENYRDFLAARRKLLADAANLFIKGLLPTDLQQSTQPISYHEGLDVPVFYEEKEPEVIIANLLTWIEGHEFTGAVMDYELVEPETGETLIIFDLAWPNGIQEGLDRPIGFCFQASQESVNMATSKGFICFSSPHAFKDYVQNAILGHLGIQGN